MSTHGTFKRTLNGTTALVSIGLLATAVAFTPISPAMAADVTISTTVIGSPAHTMLAGEALTVTSSGSLGGFTTSDSGLVIDAVAATSVNNSGTIKGDSSGKGIYIVNGGSLTGTLDNSGTIKGDTGLRLNNASSIAGGLTNSGEIRGTTRFGIRVLGASSIAGGVTNTGTIIGQSGGIRVEGAGSQITGGIHNLGADALIKGESGNGINVRTGASITGGIENSGTIEGRSASAIVFDTGTLTGDLENSGTIKAATSGSAIRLSNASIINGTLINTGTIFSASSAGVALDGGSDITGGINNSGTIDAAISSSILVLGGSDISGGVTNGGTISGSSALRVTGNSDISGGITNSGTIKGNNIGVVVTGNSDISGGITNTGTIEASSSNGLSVSTAQISGGITNSGTIKGSINAIYLNNLTGLTNLTLNGNARLVGNVRNTNRSAGFSTVTVGTAFTTEGNFEVSDLSVTAGNKLTISAGNTITLDDMSASAGTFDFAIDSTASFGKIIVDGAGNDIDLTGATVTAKVGSGTIANGDELKIGDGVTQITGLTGAAGQAATAITDNSFLWGFQLADGSQAEVTTGGADNTELYLIVAEENTIDGSADSASNAGAGNALQGLSGSTDAGIQSLLEDINTAPTQAALNDVLEGMQPDRSGGAVLGALKVSNASIRTTTKRLASLRGSGSGVASGDAMQGLRMWGQAFGTSSDQDRRDNVSGYDLSSKGLAVGLDTENIADNAVVGMAFSYANTDVDSKSINNASTDVDSYQFTIYGDYDIDDRTYVSGMAAYTRHQNDTTRNPSAGVTAKGSYDADQYSFNVESGRDYAQNGFVLTPNVMAHWSHYTPDSYTETGAGGAGLTVDGDSVDVLEFGVGTTASWEYKNDDGSIIEPSVRVGYKYDVIGDNVETSSNFIAGGNTFKTKGFDPAQSTFDIGAGVKYYSTNNVELTADYDFEYKSDYTSHSGFLRAAMKF